MEKKNMFTLTSVAGCAIVNIKATCEMTFSLASQIQPTPEVICTGVGWIWLARLALGIYLQLG